MHSSHCCKQITKKFTKYVHFFCSFLGKSLGKRTLIRSLDLEENELESGGLIAFSNGLKDTLTSSHSIEYLNLKTNLVGGSGGISLCHLFSKKVDLVDKLSIDLEENMFSEDNLTIMRKYATNFLSPMPDNDPEGDALILSQQPMQLPSSTLVHP